MRVIVHSTAIQHRDAAGLALDKFRRRFPWLELIWADGGYNAWQVDAAVAKVPRLGLAVVKQSDDMKDFVVLPRCWVVERTFSWFARNGRVAKDCENLAEALATFITPAFVQPGPRRFAREWLNNAGRGVPVPLPATNTAVLGSVKRRSPGPVGTGKMRRFRPFALPRPWAC